VVCPVVDCPSCPCSGIPAIAVAIEQGVSQVKSAAPPKLSSVTIVPVETRTNAAMNAFYAQPKAGGVTVNQMQSGAMGIEPTGNGYVYIGDHWYRGTTLVFPTDKGLTAVNYVDLEQYLYSVLGEMNGNWPQALKAQAVAARTAIYKRENEKNGIYDLGDTQASQVYKGSESSGTHKAVNATDGQVLIYKVGSFSRFHACSGGHTKRRKCLVSIPYLRGVQDFDQNVRECQWVKTLSGQEISSRFLG